MFKVGDRVVIQPCAKGLVKRHIGESAIFEGDGCDTYGTEGDVRFRDGSVAYCLEQEMKPFIKEGNMFKVGDKVIIQPNAKGVARKYIGRMATIDYVGPVDVLAVVTYLPDGSFREFGCLPSEIKLCEEEKKVFTKADIKPGMAVVVKSGRTRYMCIAIPVERGLALAHFNATDSNVLWNADFVENCPELGETSKTGPQIEAVYSESTYDGVVFDGAEFSTYRSLLWERQEVREVTVAEIEEKFGCKVKIVGETDGE